MNYDYLKPRPIGSPDRHKLRANVLFLLLSLAASNFAVAAQAADQLVIESALLRLTQQIEVPARAQGVISSMKVAEGDLVQQDAILAQVDDAESKLLHDRAAMELQLQKEKVRNDVAIRTAQKALAFHRAEFERLDKAVRGLPGSISTSELEEVRFRADQAELELEQAQYELRIDQQTAALKNKELELTQFNVNVRKVTAPINGVVVEVLRHPGEWVEPGDKVLRVVRIDRLRAEGLVHVRELPPDLVGAAVTIAVDVPGKEEKEFSGKVTFVSPEVNPVNGQTRVWAEIDNKDGMLRPGLRPRMTIQLPPPAKRSVTVQRQATQ
jgi:multidrug efflux pump subunit AcrA (membrane-fusion protein)